MKKITNDSYLKIREFYIYRLLDSDDQTAISVLEKLKIYYSIEDLNKKTVYYKVLNCLYIKRDTIPKWKLANLCNVSESTLFRIRRNILNYFLNCYDELKRNTITAN